MVYDVLTKSIDQIPCLVGSNEESNSSEHSGMHALSINPSRTLLATGAKNSNEIGIYKLPTLDPAYIGEVSHLYHCSIRAQLLDIDASINCRTVTTIGYSISFG